MGRRQDRKVGKTSWREVMGKAPGHFHPAGQGLLGKLPSLTWSLSFSSSLWIFLKARWWKSLCFVKKHQQTIFWTIFSYVIATQHYKACGSGTSGCLSDSLRLHLPSEWMLSEDSAPNSSFLSFSRNCGDTVFQKFTNLGNTEDSLFSTFWVLNKPKTKRQC